MSSSVVWKNYRACRREFRRRPSQLCWRAVGREHEAVVVDDQLALVQRVHELGPAVEVDGMRIAKAQVDQPVLDHARRHPQQHQQVLLRHVGAAADIEHGGDVAGRVVDRHRRAGERRVLGEEVFVQAYGNGTGDGDAGAHAVRARLGLAPHRTHFEA
jgi:hypothetical protein